MKLLLFPISLECWLGVGLFFSKNKSFSKSCRTLYGVHRGSVNPLSYSILAQFAHRKQQVHVGYFPPCTRQVCVRFFLCFQCFILTLIFVRAEKKPRIHGNVLGEREIRAAANARSLIFKSFAAESRRVAQFERQRYRKTKKKLERKTIVCAGFSTRVQQLQDKVRFFYYSVPSFRLASLFI